MVAKYSIFELHLQICVSKLKHVKTGLIYKLILLVLLIAFIYRQANSSNKTTVAIAASVSVSIGILLLLVSCIVWKKKQFAAKFSGNTLSPVSFHILSKRILCSNKMIAGMYRESEPPYIQRKDVVHEKDEENMDISVYTWDTIGEATDFFSHRNKIGEGGFGPVYKVKCTD